MHSYELRTPLSAGRALLQVAISEPEPTETLRATCEELVELGDRQERLIAAPLTLANSQRGLGQTESLDLAEITRKINTLNMPAGQEPRIKVVGEFRSADREPFQRGLWVIVSRSQYDQAIEAQRTGRWVDATGRLITANRRLEMRPDRFDIRRP